eukprot:6491828-Amphidinium_carterae.2
MEVKRGVPAAQREKVLHDCTTHVKPAVAARSNGKVYKTTEAQRVYSNAYHGIRNAYKGKLSGLALKVSVV